MNQPLAEMEHEIRQLIAVGSNDEATTRVLERFGPELLALLHARMRNLQEARDAFAWLAEDIWRGIPRFRGDSSLRTWVYAIARNAGNRYAARELRPRMAEVPLSQLSRQSALAVQLPSTQGSEGRIARIREQLDPDEQTLLTLRVDKNMSFRDMAVVWLYEGDGDPATVSEAAVEREAARLRKRFQLLKDKLRVLAANMD